MRCGIYETAEHPSVCRSVSVTHRSTATVACSGFATEHHAAAEVNRQRRVSNSSGTAALRSAANASSVTLTANMLLAQTCYNDCPFLYEPHISRSSFDFQHFTRHSLSRLYLISCACFINFSTIDTVCLQSVLFLTLPRIYVTVGCPSIRLSVPSVDSSTGVQLACQQLSSNSWYDSFYRVALCWRGICYGTVSVSCLCLSQVDVVLKRLNTGLRKRNDTCTGTLVF